MGTEVSFNGMDALLESLQQLGDNAEHVEDQALKVGAAVLQTAMSKNVAVSDRNETHIRDDIKVSKVKVKNGEAKYVEVGPSKKTGWRAPFLEFGTSRMSARPFMDPAARESQEEIISAMADVVKAGLNL